MLTLCEGGLCFQEIKSAKVKTGTIRTIVQSPVYIEQLGTLGRTLPAQLEHCITRLKRGFTVAQALLLTSSLKKGAQPPRLGFDNIAWN